MTPPPRDILEYKPRIMSDRVFNRRLALSGLTEGKFSIPEFCSLFFLPGKWRSKEISAKRDVFKLAYWKRALSDFLNQDGSINLFGSRFYTASGNYWELNALLQEMIVSDQYETKEFMKDGDIVIDAGANIGMFSVKAAHDFPGIKVYAFEPSARTFAALTKNTADYSSITCINMGLGDAENKKIITQLEFGPGGARMEDSSIGALASPWEKMISETASITTIDTYVKEHDLQKVDFLKIDTEGYEAKILTGAAETIRTHRPVIAMSAYHTPSDKEGLPKLLKSICPDYICELRDTGEENLICHL
jgi:FkbM family methyltransferase